MSPEERQLLQGLFDRIRNSAGTPRDREAESFIADNIRQQPYAPYLLAQTVIVQDQALQAANTRLQQLETQIGDLQRQGGPQQQPGSGGFLSGIGALFGGASSQPSGGQQPPQGGFGSVPPARPAWGQPPQPQGYAPPPPSYAPQQGYAPPQQGGPWGAQPPQASGGGFLHGALGAAAGVAGGVLLADSIRGLFGGHNNGLGIASGFGGGGLGGGGGETVINNFYGDDQGAGGGDYTPSADYQQDPGGQDISDGLDDFSDSSDYTDT